MPRPEQTLALAARPLAKPRPATPARSRRNQDFAAVARAWSDADYLTRAQWQKLANQMPHKTGLRTPGGRKQTRPLNAFQCFSSISLTCLAIGLPLTQTAPNAPTAPAPVPPAQLSALSTPSSPSIPSSPFPPREGSPSSAGVGSFTLTLTLPAARKPAILAALHAHPGGPLDLTALYRAKYGPLHPGQQVILTLVPVHPDGFKGTPSTSPPTSPPPKDPPRPPSNDLSLPSEGRVAGLARTG